MSVRFARNSLLGALAGVSITLASFLSGVVVARVLGVEGAGAVAYAVWLALLVVPFIDLGMSFAVGRYIPELRGRGEYRTAELLSGHLFRILSISVMVMIGLVAAIAAVPALSVYVWKPDGDGGQAICLLVVAYIAALAFGTFAYARLRGAQAFDQVARIAGFSLFFQVAFVTAGSLAFGISGAVAGYVAGQILPAAVAWRSLRRTEALDPELRQRVRRYARYAWAAGIANTLVWARIEIFFLERAWGSDAVGIFAVALALSSLATQGPVMLTMGVLPLFSEQYGRRDSDAMKAACATGTRLLAAVVFPCCLGMAAVMPVVLPMIYGEAFAAALPAAIVLVCAAAISASTVVATNFVYARERTDFVFASSLFGATLSIVTGFVLVPAFGVLGAAASRAVIQVALVVSGAWFIVRRLECPLPFAALARLFAAALVCASVAGLCVAVIGGAASLLIAIPTGAVAYAIALRLLRALPRSDLDLLRGIAETLPEPAQRAAKTLFDYLGNSPRVRDGARPRGEVI